MRDLKGELERDCSNTSLLPPQLPSMSVKTSNVIPTLTNIEQYGELSKLQQQDPDIGPILKWRKISSARPPREKVARYSPTTKLYWAQWKSLVLEQGVLHHLWESPAGDRTIS